MSLAQLKDFPSSWPIMEKVLQQFEEKILDVLNENNLGKYQYQHTWNITSLLRNRSRYIYEMFYIKKCIPKDLYLFCIENKLADHLLIAKWKKTGYENLCCLRCIHPSNTATGKVCICRVNKNKLAINVEQCHNCGCSGCAGSGQKNA